MTTLIIDGPLARLDATLRLPGDKSIAHRALLIAAVADGTSRITNLPDGQDVAATRRAIERLGAALRPVPGGLEIDGHGFAGLDRAPGAPLVLDCGNSGTTARLLCGLLAGRTGSFRLRGDASLSRRPMARVVRPLRRMGGDVTGGPRLPLVVRGSALAAPAAPFETGSAQVRAALLLAGLQARGTTRIVLDRPARDHDLRLLAAAGAPVAAGADGAVSVSGPVAALAPLDVVLPGDPSSAAPFAALAAAIPGARVRLEGISVNPSRLGFYRVLERMGARIRVRALLEGPEPRGTIEVRHGGLRGVRLEADEAAGCIDELPLVALLGALARGTTTIEGAGELRVKESDRLARTAEILRRFGAPSARRSDGLSLHGGARLAPATVDGGDDHRMVMLAATAAALAAGRSAIAGADRVAVSFPAFAETLRVAGARVGAA